LISSTTEPSALSDDVTDTIETTKSRLIQLCKSSSKNLDAIRDAMFELEQQASDIDPNRLISGEWELLYASTDMTRSSPFFWAFRKAFPDSTSDAIFGITDAIPAPLKEVGPAFQEIDVTAGPNNRGRLISRVQVATLGGAATSIMTTRASLLGAIDGDARRLRLKIETTKPEQSTILDKLLGPLSATLQEQLPPFPSGDALERIVPGASEVVLLTTFCDATLRISKNDDRPDDEFFIWQRKSFASYDVL
jgi:PAP_fibrillin